MSLKLNIKKKNLITVQVKGVAYFRALKLNLTFVISGYNNLFFMIAESSFKRVFRLFTE